MYFLLKVSTLIKSEIFWGSKIYVRLVKVRKWVSRVSGSFHKIKYKIDEQMYVILKKEKYVLQRRQTLRLV